ncbi:acetamidase/formamidase family protein [Pararhizobium sp.]|uniref:acetamidase/formamidase family protein n=1 Tax=Pararhizobium sp. TaxID=1977563 RepID=UPI002727D027|nr:acetamidase/formamidase family protein [Pararhizobium sp.]MDO9415838.1 acetamidase/formamidase family protein [Pararhizobium sp.]
MAHHVLKSSVENCHWGYFDATRRPVLSIKSGDTVTIDSVSGQPAHTPKPGGAFVVPPELTDIHARATERGPGPHILTGPVAIEGAKPGHVLEVRIKAVNLRQNWAYNAIVPLTGVLPNDFDEPSVYIIPIDIEKKTAALPWGVELPLSPFFGVMGVAPMKGWGRITTVMPRSMGGNLDNKDLGAGSTLYLPVFNEGALFSCGDGHAAQGHGEVCVTAIETALEGTFEFILREDLSFTYPRAETATHYITMGMDPDLDRCTEMALRDMIALLNEKVGLSKADAYRFASVAADFHVTQAVNGSKGVHAMIAKDLVHQVK